MLDMEEFQKIFEFEIRTKLSRRCRSTNEEIRVLYNSFKFYDLENCSIIDKISWIKGIQKTGLCGFNVNDLADLFSRYDINNTGYINYKNFTFYIYHREELIPLSKEIIEGTFKIIRENNMKLGRQLPNIEFKPPGLYDRSFEIMLDNEKKFKRINKKITEINKKIGEEKINNYIKKIKKTPYIKRNNYSLPDLTIQNYSLFFENEKKNKKLFQCLKSKINVNNGITYYSFMKELKNYQNPINKTINVNNMHFVLRNLGIPFKFYDLIQIFKSIGELNSDKINTNELLKLIRGEINLKRKTSLENVFKMNDKNKMGKISIEEMKSLYNSSMHPDVYLGYKKQEEVYTEFCFTFDVFCDFYDIKDYINCDQFIDYYKGISASICDDNYFDDIINGVWDINIVRSKIFDSNIKDNMNINRNYNKVFRRELISNKINSTNNYVLNNRYVNTPPKDKFVYDSYEKCPNTERKRNVFEEEEKQRVNASSIINMPKLEESKFNTINPYNTPIKNQLFKSVKIPRNISYNPITNEFNINKDKARQKYLGYKSPFKHNILNNLERIKEIIISRGQKGIFNFQKLCSLYDKDKTGQITYIKFVELCEIYNVDIERENLKEIFDLYDKEKIGIINYDDLIHDLIKNISVNRAIMIKNLYNEFPQDKYGNVSINDLRKRFKPFNHPFVKDGTKSEPEIYFEFLDCINIFKFYKSIISKNSCMDVINFGGFFDFFKEISFSIKNDLLFECILINCFSKNTINENELKNNEDNLRILKGY